MTDRILWLTWRSVLTAAAVEALLLLLHAAAFSWFLAGEPVLSLLSTFLFPLWAICAGVYTFDSLAFTRMGSHGRVTIGPAGHHTHPWA